MSDFLLYASVVALFLVCILVVLVILKIGRAHV